MLPLSGVLEEQHGEIFPFFSWRLFSSAPAWNTSEYALLLHSIDGRTVDTPLYLIPSHDIRDWKVLRQAAKACTTGRHCDDTVADMLYPIVLRSTGSRSAEFSIIRARIDLRDIQANIYGISTQEVKRTAFFVPRAIIGRWDTGTGRLQ